MFSHSKYAFVSVCSISFVLCCIDSLHEWINVNYIFILYILHHTCSVVPLFQIKKCFRTVKCAPLGLIILLIIAQYICRGAGCLIERPLLMQWGVRHTSIGPIEELLWESWDNTGSRIRLWRAQKRSWLLCAGKCGQQSPALTGVLSSFSHARFMLSSLGSLMQL